MKVSENWTGWHRAEAKDILIWKDWKNLNPEEDLMTENDRNVPILKSPQEKLELKDTGRTEAQIKL